MQCKRYQMSTCSRHPNHHLSQLQPLLLVVRFLRPLLCHVDAVVQLAAAKAPLRRGDGRKGGGLHVLLRERRLGMKCIGDILLPQFQVI